MSIIITSLLVMAAAILIRKLFSGKLSGKALMVIWAIVFVKLAIPVSIPAAFSVMNLFAEKPAQTEILKETVQPELNIRRENIMPYHAPSGNAAPYTNGGNYTPQTAPADTGSAVIKMSFWEIVNTVYVIVASVLAAAVLLAYAVCAVRFGTFEDIEVPEKFAEKGIRFRKGNVGTPAVFGIFRPVILFPENTSVDGSATFEHIILHEKTHIRHRDQLFNLLTLIICCMNWYDPLAWICRTLYLKDAEKWCDESVIAHIGRANRKAYAESLLACAVERSSPFMLVSGFGESDIKGRIKSIMNDRKFKRGASVVVVLLAVTVFAAFGTGKTEKKDIPAPAAEQEETRTVPPEAAVSAPAAEQEVTRSVPPEAAVPAAPREELYNDMYRFADADLRPHGKNARYYQKITENGQVRALVELCAGRTYFEGSNQSYVCFQIDIKSADGSYTPGEVYADVKAGGLVNYQIFPGKEKTEAKTLDARIDFRRSAVYVDLREALFDLTFENSDYTFDAAVVYEVKKGDTVVGTYAVRITEDDKLAGYLSLTSSIREYDIDYYREGDDGNDFADGWIIGGEELDEESAKKLIGKGGGLIFREIDTTAEYEDKLPESISTLCRSYLRDLWNCSMNGGRVDMTKYTSPQNCMDTVKFLKEGLTGATLLGDSVKDIWFSDQQLEYRYVGEDEIWVKGLYNTIHERNKSYRVNYGAFFIITEKNGRPELLYAFDTQNMYVTYCWSGYDNVTYSDLPIVKDWSSVEMTDELCTALLETDEPYESANSDGRLPKDIAALCRSYLLDLWNYCAGGANFSPGKYTSDQDCIDLIEAQKAYISGIVPDGEKIVDIRLQTEYLTDYLEARHGRLGDKTWVHLDSYDIVKEDGSDDTGFNAYFEFIERDGKIEMLCAYELWTMYKMLGSDFYEYSYPLKLDAGKVAAAIKAEQSHSRDTEIVFGMGLPGLIKSCEVWDRALTGDDSYHDHKQRIEIDGWEYEKICVADSKWVDVSYIENALGLKLIPRDGYYDYPFTTKAELLKSAEKFFSERYIEKYFDNLGYVEYDGAIYVRPGAKGWPGGQIACAYIKEMTEDRISFTVTIVGSIAGSFERNYVFVYENGGWKQDF